MREALFEAARERINVFYADQGNLEDPKSRDGVIYRLSKDDKDCGGDGVPVTFVEYDIDGVRPIDAFNVMVDAQSQPSWDNHCASMDALGEVEALQARGFAGLFVAPGMPVAGREAFEWEFVEGNFTTEEFWIMYTTLQNDDLRQRGSLKPGAVEMQNCLAAYKITKTATGVHVVNTQQVNSHPWPLTARYVANAGFDAAVDFAGAYRKVAATQKALGWPANKSKVPSWMLDDRPCGALRADTTLRDSLLNSALTELSRTDIGKPQQAVLPGGQKISIWRRDAACGGSGVSSEKVPAWTAEFEVGEASPEEVFNVIVAKATEGQWNSRLLRTNLTGFSRGARGVHEEIQLPRTGLHTWTPRELWEWQAANHSPASRTYLLGLTSASPGTSFGGGAVQAFQCVEAFSVGPDASGSGASVRMSTHLNPNEGMLSRFWPGAGESMLKEFAAALSGQAVALHRQRAGGELVDVDGGALALLAPPPPDRNGSLTVAAALAAAARKDAGAEVFPRLFAALDLPAVLDSSAWPVPEREQRASDVVGMFRLLEQNATAEESAAFEGGVTTSPIALQLQGEALAAIQLRFIQDLAVKDCQGGALPDFDHNKKPQAGISLPVLIAAAAGVLVLVGLVVALCVWRYKRWRRNRRARDAAAAAIALLSRVESQTPTTWPRPPAAPAAACAPPRRPPEGAGAAVSPPEVGKKVVEGGHANDDADSVDATTAASGSVVLSAAH